MTSSVDLDTFDPTQCARLILCGLTRATLGALKSVIDVQISVLTAEIATLQAQLVALDVATFPISAAKALANDALRKARSAATLVPFTLIAGCTPLGDFGVNFVRSIDSATAELNNLLDDLNRILSFRAEIVAAVAELTAVIEQFRAIELVIQECGA